MSYSDYEALSSTQIRSSVPAWLDALGRVNRERLEALLPVFADGTAVLGDALQIVAPGKGRAAALAAYQTFAKRVNDAASDAGLPYMLKVDSQKKSDPSDRETWIEGPSPDIDNLAQFTREAVSTLDQQDQLVPPTAAILSAEEQENPDSIKPLIRFFASYAHSDEKVMRRLYASLEKELQASKRYRFEIWSDRQIEVGADWDQQIKTALQECHFGLLFVSRDFLISRYITKNELPPFVTGDKPVIPIGLKPVDFDRVDMKGLESKQIFRLLREGQEPRFFSKCRGEMAEDFVRELASEIERKISVSKTAPTDDTEFAGDPESDEPEDDFVRDVHRLGHNIVANTEYPDCAVDPKAATAANLKVLEEDPSVLAANSTSAVDYLADWAISKDGARFCAVLGELGIGKTTTLMLLARELDWRRESDPTVPPVIFIDLKDYHFDKDHPGLEDILQKVITRHWKGDSGKAVTPDMVIRAVRERKALVIFDGLDERIIPLPQQQRDAFIRTLWSILPPLAQKSEPEKQPGRLIISCRSHYFPTVTALSSAFTGEGREGIRQQDYNACIILPFTDDQVRDYLNAMLGEDRAEQAVEIINSVHNLSDLSKRPLLLSMIAPELAKLEQLKKAGRTVLGVTLYGLFVEKWLRRDDNKHQFTPEHKVLMMEALAAHLCQQNQRKLPWNKVARWLDDFLNQHPEIRDRYQDKPAEVLNQDFRAATFCLRPDDDKDGFRFAHTSLYEYFLALHLVRALEEGRPEAWDLPLPSDETLDFAGQLLVEGEVVETDAAVDAWTQLLDNPQASADARRAAFRMWLIAHQNNWPVPQPTACQLQGLDLEGWNIGTESGDMFDLRNASLNDACLDHAILHRVLLNSCDAQNVSARHVQLHGVNLSQSCWEHANLCGGTWRHCTAAGIQAESANWHDCDLVECNVADATVPENWSRQAAVQVAESDWKIAVRSGHRYSVCSVSWSKDGQKLVSGSDDKTLKVWDAESGRCTATLQGHSYSVSSVSWSPDGQKLASGSHDRTLKIWNTDNGHCMATLEGHYGPVYSVSWSPNGQKLVSGSDDKALKVWNVDSGSCSATLEEHTDRVFSVWWSPDGQKLASGSEDRTVKIWNADDGYCMATLEGHNGPVYSVSWSPDGQKLVSGSDDKTLKVWNAESGRCTATLEGHYYSVSSVSWSPDGQKLVSGSSDNSMKVWDIDTGRCIATLEGHSGLAYSISWSPDGQKLVSGSADTKLKVWDVDSGRCMVTLGGRLSSVNCVPWSSDGLNPVPAVRDRVTSESETESGRLPWTWVVGGGEKALVDFSRNRILHASPGAWRLLGWEGYDPVAKRRRLLPAEIFGPLPPWPEL